VRKRLVARDAFRTTSGGRLYVTLSGLAFRSAWRCR